MKAKELGWIVSIDQASNEAGVSIWHDGDLMGHTVLKSNSSRDPIGKRLVTQVEQLDTFLEGHGIDYDEIKLVLFEGVRSRIVLVTVGAFLCSRYLQNCRIHQKHNFVESSSWKRWAIRNGAVADRIGDIKGCKALSETGFDMTGIDSDDIADSIMIYLTWRER